MIVETKRLIIRKITMADAAFILRLVNEPSFVSNIGDKGLKNRHDAKTIKMFDGDPGTVLYSKTEPGTNCRQDQ